MGSDETPDTPEPLDDDDRVEDPEIADLPLDESDGEEEGDDRLHAEPGGDG